MTKAETIMNITGDLLHSINILNVHALKSNFQVAAYMSYAKEGPEELFTAMKMIKALRLGPISVLAQAVIKNEKFKF